MKLSHACLPWPCSLWPPSTMTTPAWPGGGGGTGCSCHRAPQLGPLGISGERVPGVGVAALQGVTSTLKSHEHLNSDSQPCHYSMLNVPWGQRHGSHLHGQPDYSCQLQLSAEDTVPIRWHCRAPTRTCRCRLPRCGIQAVTRTEV